MTQNIYDDPAFFEGYRRLPRSVNGLAGAPEWPSLRALLPDVNGLRVVDLGCGFGWFCRWARQRGAARVLGLDASQKMLERAKADTADPAIVYERVDLARGPFRARARFQAPATTPCRGANLAPGGVPALRQGHQPPSCLVCLSALPVARRELRMACS